MKKLFLLLGLVAVLLSSCEVNTTAEFKKTESGNEYISINGRDYYKVKVGDHDMYQYTFSAYAGTGSDVFHLDDLCEYCKNKKEVNQ